MNTEHIPPTASLPPTATGDATPSSASYPQRGSTGRRRWGFPLVLVVLVVLWALAILFRMELRAQWWSYRLVRVESREDRLFYTTRLAAIGDKALGAVGRLLDDPREEIRQMGITVLHYCQSPAAGERLLNRLADPNARVVAMAATELGLRPDASSFVNRLRERIDTNSPATAWGACVGLERMGGPEAETILLEALSVATDADVRAQIIDSLGMLGSKAAVPKLIELLADERAITKLPASQHSVLLAIGALQTDLIGKGVRPQTLVEVSQSQPTVASVAGRSLRLITGLSLEDPTTQPADLRPVIRQRWETGWQQKQAGQPPASL